MTIPATLPDSAGYTLIVPVDQFGQVYPRRGPDGRPAMPVFPGDVEPASCADELGFTTASDTAPAAVIDAVWAGLPMRARTLPVRRPDRLPPETLPPLRPAEAVKLIGEGAINDLFAIAALLRLHQAGLIKEKLDIVYQDDYCAVVHKPAGMLVHRQAGDPDRETLLQLLRQQLGRPVQPVHRLDKPTSGLVLFALGREHDRAFHELFQTRAVHKAYWALVRGHTDPEGMIDYPLKDDTGRLQEAVTTYRRLATTELPIPVGPYQTARYSLIEATIATGRTHQIRRHFNHLRHPLIGDAQHGDGKHNRVFREQFNCYRMMLAAVRLEFTHPVTGREIKIAATPDFSFSTVLDAIGITQAEESSSDRL